MSATCRSINGCLKQTGLYYHCTVNMDRYIAYLKKLYFYLADICWKVIFVLVLVVYIFCEATATACTSPGKYHSYNIKDAGLPFIYEIFLYGLIHHAHNVSFHCMHYTVGRGLVKVSWRLHPIVYCLKC